MGIKAYKYRYKWAARYLVSIERENIWDKEEIFYISSINKGIFNELTEKKSYIP